MKCSISSWLCRRVLIGLTSVVSMAVMSESANAALQWDWSYYGSGISAAGMFTTTDTPDGSGFYRITGISGERNGDAIIGLQPAGTAIPGNEPYAVDDLVRLANGQLTINGFGYATAIGDYANPYYANNSYDEVLTSSSGGFISELPVNFTATLATVPEPETQLLILVGLGLMGFFVKIRNPENNGQV